MDELYQWALDQIAGNAPIEQVNAFIKEESGRRGIAGGRGYPNVFALRMAMESSQHQQEAEEMQQIGEHPIRSAVGSMSQGIPIIGPWLDEIVGATSAGRQVGPAMGRAQAARSEHAPGADLASQFAGGLLTAGMPAANIATRPVTGVMSGAVRGAARGGLVGAAGGAAAGAGFAEEGERVEGAVRGAKAGGVVGGVLGAPMGAVGGLFGSASGRGARIADEIYNMTGLQRRPEAITRLAAEKAEVQTTFYRPLQQKFAQVQDLPIERFLEDLGTDRNLRTVVPPKTRDLIRRNAASHGRSQPMVQPSFEDLQDLRNALRARAYDRAGDVADREALARMEELTELMQDAIGPELEAADAAWASVSGRERAMERGWQMYNKEADLIDEAREAMSPEQLEFFDSGRLARITAKMGERDRGAVGLLTQYMDAGPDTERRVASLFPGGLEGGQYANFKHLIRSEATKAAIIDFFNSTVKSAAIGATGGAIAGGLMSRGQN